MIAAKALELPPKSPISPVNEAEKVPQMAHSKRLNLSKHIGDTHEPDTI
jgi:hypothetical protein